MHDRWVLHLVVGVMLVWLAAMSFMLWRDGRTRGECEQRCNRFGGFYVTLVTEPNVSPRCVCEVDGRLMEPPP